MGNRGSLHRGSSLQVDTLCRAKQQTHARGRTVIMKELFTLIFYRASSLKHSYDDAEQLLNALLLLSALGLAFGFTATAGFVHEDLIAADKRIFFETEGRSGAITLEVMTDAAWASAMMTLSLSVGVWSYVSLQLSNAREDQAALAAWL